MDRLADRALVPVGGGRVEVAVAGTQRAGDDLLGLLWRDLEDAEAELGDLHLGAERHVRDSIGCAGHLDKQA